MYQKFSFVAIQIYMVGFISHNIDLLVPILYSGVEIGSNV